MVGRSSKWFVAVVLILVALSIADDAEARRRRRRGLARGRNTNFLRALQQAQLLNLILASQVAPTGLGGFYPGIHGGGSGGIDLRPIAPTQSAPPAAQQGQQQSQTTTGAPCDQTKALNTLMAAKGRCTGCHSGIDFKIENSKVVITGAPKGNSDLSGFIRAVGRVSQMTAFEDVVKQLSPSGCQN